jgi:crotonobetainyl-CoA:carnitine CoA-transferase CaiB-like acyl-CoA transferase
MPAMLEEIRVVDLTSVVFGPYATANLADLGADVIKVEPPGGDMFRGAGNPAKTPMMGACHMTLNRGKRSVVLDLKDPVDAKVMRDLLATADVFIHNVRARAIERLGLGYEAVRALREDIIYVHCAGFGAGGRYRDLQAYDDIIQAATGTCSLASRVDGDPRPRYVPSLVADKVSGLHGTQAVLAALVHKLRTGEGQYVEVPMFESFAHFALVEHLFGLTFDPPTSPAGYPRQLDPNRQPFPTADGHVSIVPYTEDIVQRLFALLGAPEVLEAPEFATREARLRNMTQLYTAVARLTPRFTTDELVAMLHEAQIPALPCRDLADILSDPHLADAGFFRRRTHPTEGDYFEMQPPIRYAAAPARDLRMPPKVGEHTQEIKNELAARTG